MRMIAGILGCPFHLNILDDSIITEEDLAQNEAEFNIEEQVEPEMEESGAFIEAQEMEEPEESVEEILAEIEAFEIEKPEKTPVKAEEPKAAGPVKKSGGWRSYLQRWKRKIEDDGEELSVDEFPTEMEYVEENEEFIEDEEMQTEEIQEPLINQIADQIEEAIMKRADEEPEDITIGDVNPYTGHEYKSNSVRMHPKRIGYVQVYDRGGHKWTEMTEWAFLGYQERMKAILGEDYEPPTYLD